MRQIILTLSLLTSLLGAPRMRLAVPSDPAAEPASGSVVCPPAAYTAVPDDCVALGPSQTIAELGAAGIPYPMLPLPAYDPDPALVGTSYAYLKLTHDDQVFYLFDSLDEAESNTTSGRAIGPGQVYVSYVDRVENDQGVYYQLNSGAWVRGDYGARVAMHMPFQGLLFSSTPPNSFGWVMGTTTSQTAPGFGAPSTGKTYYRYNVVQVYAAHQADGTTWVEVGPDEWLDYRQVARVDPRRGPPPGVPTDRWIEINLDEQTIAVYQGNQLTFATLTSTGVENLWTRPGLFQVYYKTPSEDMTGATEADRSDFYYIEDVPWTMYFDEDRALHGAFWHDFFGYPNSHGCVNLPVGDAHWLFDWAVEGDYVYVYDPSGRTPTDPSLYGPGAP
jgi:lipoprotein-anchoring transpeptidase ErfK/SrfK